MEREIFKNWILEHKKDKLGCIFTKKEKEKKLLVTLTNYLLENSTISKRIFHILNDLVKIPKCQHCNIEMKFKNLKQGYNCRKRSCYIKNNPEWAENHSKKISSHFKKYYADPINKENHKNLMLIVNNDIDKLNRSSEKMKENWSNEDYKAKMINALTGIEHSKGWKLTEEQRKNQSEAQLKINANLTSEQKEQRRQNCVSAANIRWENMTEEQFEQRSKKITTNNIEIWKRPGYKENHQEFMREWHKNNKVIFTEEVLEDMSKKSKENWNSPERKLEMLQKRTETMMKKYGVPHNNQFQNNEKFYSEISQELFNVIHNKLENKNVYFSVLNKEYFLRDDENRFYFYDFTSLDNKKIIEFNGDYWHANPLIYEATDLVKLPGNPKMASEIWQQDVEKIDFAKSKGFDVLVIWESEYKDNKEETIQKCLDFLVDNQIKTMI